jgi:hypothetical protein
MHLTRTILASWLSSLALGAGVLASASARAQSADEYVLILLDRTTSMGDPAVAGATSPTFWDNAIAAAQNWVRQDKLAKKGDARPARAYAVWTFLDDFCSKNSGSGHGCPNTQQNVKQVWPLSAADCVANKGGTYEGSSAMCVIAGEAAGDALYDILTNKVLGGLGKQKPAAQSNTPLADSLCLAMEKLHQVARDKPQLLLLETDGGDSSSASACAGFGSVPLPGDVFNKKSEGWGLTLGSWQENFLRRTIRIGRFPPRPDDPGASAAQQRAAIKFGRGVLLPGERLPQTLRVRADLHYAICDPASPSAVPCADVDRSADPPSRDLVAKGAPKRPSIHPGELSFFKALVQALPGSQVREFLRVPASSLGLKHKIAGDVDDSGCVDDADLQIMTGKDVWLQRALPPSQDGVRADLNRDGWVNQKDAAVLLGTWGKGCGKSASKKPDLPE